MSRNRTNGARALQSVLGAVIYAGLVSCNNNDSFSTAPGLLSSQPPTAPTAGATGGTGGGATPTGGPTVITTATPVPGGAPPICTQSCQVPNGVGTQNCGAPSSTCTISICNSGFIVQNGNCVSTTSYTAFKCTEYLPLNLNTSSNQLVPASGGSSIPAQDPSGSGSCYFYPVVISTLSGASSLTGTAVANHDQTIVSRDHDANTTSPTVVWHPYSLFHASFNFTLAASRVVQLAGGGPEGTTFNSQPLTIDNFFVIGIYPTSVGVTTSNILSYYSAYGTGDSVVTDPLTNMTNSVLFNPAGINLVTNAMGNYPTGSTPYSSSGVVTESPYVAIPLNVLAPAGTAVVPQVQITNDIQPNVSSTIDIRGLDAGGMRVVTPVYLVIQ